MNHLVSFPVSLDIQRNNAAFAAPRVITYTLSCGFKVHFDQFFFQVSLPTFVPAPVARPSLSVCLTIGRSYQEIHLKLTASLVLLWRTHASVKVSRKKSQLWTTTWTNYKHATPSRLFLIPLIKLKSGAWTVQNTMSTLG